MSYRSSPFVPQAELHHSRQGENLRVLSEDIPSEAVLEQVRQAEGRFYQVGTPRSKVRQCERKRVELPWKNVQEQVQVELFTEQGELYAGKSEGRQAKERAMRRKRLAGLLPGLR